MFDTAGWVESEPVHGPVPLAPLPGWTVSEVLAFADRAPFTGAWIDALIQAARPGSDGVMLGEAARLRLIRAWDRLRQGAEAQFLGAVGVLAEQSCPPEDPDCPGGNRCTHDWSREELAACLHLAPQSASALLTDSRELSGRAAVLLDAVHDGRLPAYAARRIAHRLTGISDPSTVALVLSRIMGTIGTRTPGQLDRLTALTIESLRDPAEALAAHHRAHRAQTGITPGLPLDDGMGTAVLTASITEIAELLTWARTITTSNRTHGDTRTVGQRRIDALLTALTTEIDTSEIDTSEVDTETSEAGEVDTETSETTTASTAPTAPPNAAPAPADPAPATADAYPVPEDASPASSATAGTAQTASSATPTTQSGTLETTQSGTLATRTPARRPPIALRLMMTADTLLGRTNDPAWLTGVGSIPAYLARTLAITPTALQHALTDTRGHLLHLGRDHRLALTDLDRHIRARDLTCTWPGCTRASTNCDLDHIHTWAHGGHTDEANLHPLCKRHHRARHHGWTPHRNPNLTTTWTSPTGTRYTTLPPDPPGHHPQPQPRSQPPIRPPNNHDPLTEDSHERDPLQPRRRQQPPPPPPGPPAPEEPPF